MRRNLTQQIQYPYNILKLKFLCYFEIGLQIISVLPR